MPIKHTPSNAIETNLLLDSYAHGQLPGQATLISPESIEINSNRGLQTFDPRLVDPSVLKALTSAYGKPYGPVPRTYGQEAPPPAAEELAQAMVKPSGLIAR